MRPGEDTLFRQVLKKHPDFDCCLALKCLALMRLGRETEASALLEKVVFLSWEKISLQLAIRGVGFKPSWWGSTQCHDHCIQGTSGNWTILRIFLIDGCQEPGKICRMYEGAVAKEPNNEEFLTHLFMSYVRLVMIVWFVFTHLFAGWESTKSKKRQPEIFTK